MPRIEQLCFHRLLFAEIARDTRHGKEGLRSGPDERHECHVRHEIEATIQLNLGIAGTIHADLIGRLLLF